jgi:hypothetical protein
VRAVCRTEGVDEPQFYWGRRKLAQAKAKAKGSAFVPLNGVTDQPDEPATRGIEVVLTNRRCLRVGPGFDPRTLVTLVDLPEARGFSF